MASRLNEKKVPLVVSGHSRPVPDLSYSPITPDGFFLVSACLDGKPMLRNGTTGDWIGTFIGHKGAVWSAHINSPALQVVTASADYTVKLWDALSGDEVHSFTHPRIVKTARFSSDDKRVVTGGQDKVLRVFDLAQAGAEPTKLEATPTDTIKAAVWSANDTLVVSGGGEGQLRVFDARTGKQVKAHACGAPITSVHAAADGTHVISTAGKQVSIWSGDTLELIRTIPLNLDINSAAISPGTPVSALSAPTSGAASSAPSPPPVAAAAAAGEPQRPSLVVGGSSFAAHVFDLETLTELEVLKGHHGPVHCVRFAPDGATFTTGSEDGTLRVWQSGPSRNYGLWQSVAEAVTTA
jgi:serine-threonine kinase receptor-associated protein